MVSSDNQPEVYSGGLSPWVGSITVLEGCCASVQLAMWLLQKWVTTPSILCVQRRSPDVEWGSASLDSNAEEEIGQLKRQLDQAASMIESYEESREEKNRELQHMKVCVDAMSCDWSCDLSCGTNITSWQTFDSIV